MPCLYGCFSVFYLCYCYYPAIYLHAYFVSFFFDSISIYGWETMIPLGFFAAIGYGNFVTFIHFSHSFSFSKFHDHIEIVK